MSTPRSLCRWLLALSFLAEGASAQEATQVRPAATVNLTFDDDSGPAPDSAIVGQAQDQANPVNDPVRIASPFWNQAGRKAIQFDAARSQYLELADSPDVDRPDALTFSLLCVNLVPTNDAAFHGLVAKRGTANGKSTTNYGINFVMQNDTAQLYINDGTGYRVAAYSAKEMLPFRKLSHLTAVIHVGDAPASDADTDADDVRFQVFVNGAPLTPKSVTNGFVDGTSGWTTDVQVAGLVNDLPVSIGRSEANSEYFSGVVDEFCLFPQALTPEQAKQLFYEVAGPNADELIRQDQSPPPAKPEIARINPPGLAIGKTSQLGIVGKNLVPSPRVTVPLPGAAVEVVDAPAADRLTVRVTLPPDAVPSIVPVWVQTEHGLSAAELIAVDHLPLVNIQKVSAQEPATMPAAYWGTLQGGNVVRLDFAGKSGQRFVADVELRRLGGQAQPVLELKSPQGTPLEIAWGHGWLGGDARIEAVLPADGLYAVDLHDLVYRAPGQNPFRLKVGDLQLLDLPFPVAANAGPVTVEPVGVGFAARTRWTTNFSPATNATAAPLPLPADVRVPGPRPLVRTSDATEIVESETSGGELQTVVATFEGTKRPIGINGRLRTKNERDRYLLQVAPGHKLRFTLQTDSIDSSVDGEVAVLTHPQGTALAMTSDQPSGADPRLDFTVPANVNHVQVAVRDLFGRGGERSIYRLEIAPAELPAFDLAVNAAAVTLPADGSTLVEVTLTRTAYNGAVALRIDGDEGLQIAPAEIPAGIAGRIFCRLQRTAPPASEDPALVRIVGASVGVEPAVTCAAVLNSQVASPAFRDTIAAGRIAAAGLSIDLVQPPATLFRGVTQKLPLALHRTPGAPAASSPVRFASQSTEPARPRQPGNPGAGNFPVVAIAPGQIAPADASQFEVAVQTPLESVEKSIQFAIIAEAVPHAYSDRVLATAHAIPFRANIENAVAPKLEDATLKVIADTDHAVTGTLQRTAGFDGPVEVTLAGLPQGYQVTPANVSGDQNEFRMVVKAPKVQSAQDVPNVKLRVTSQGSLLLTEPAVALNVVPQ